MPENTEIRKVTQPEISNWVEVEQRTWLPTESPKVPWRINVLAAASHPGGAQAILPLVNELVGHQTACRLFTPATTDGIERTATTFARNFSFVRQPGIESGTISQEIFSPDKTNLIIFGASGGGDENLELSLAKQAVELKRKGYQVLVVGVEDDASGLVGLVKQLKASGVNLEAEVDALFLANRLPLQHYQDLGVPAIKLIPTGPTGFDFLHREHTAQLGQAFRETNTISPDILVIVHTAIRGTNLWSEIEIDATPKILSAIFELAKNHPDKKFVFVYRFHPDDQRPEVLHSILTKFTETPENLRFMTHQPAETRADGRSPLAAANLAITTVSITNTGVALCGAKPEAIRPEIGHMPLYFISPTAKYELQKTGTILPTAGQIGAAAVAEEDHQLVPSMERALFDLPFRRDIFARQTEKLRDIYRFKGTATATDRALLQIRFLLKNSNLVK